MPVAGEHDTMGSLPIRQQEFKMENYMIGVSISIIIATIAAGMLIVAFTIALNQNEIFMTKRKAPRKAAKPFVPEYTVNQFLNMTGKKMDSVAYFKDPHFAETEDFFKKATQEKFLSKEHIVCLMATDRLRKLGVKEELVERLYLVLKYLHNPVHPPCNSLRDATDGYASILLSKKWNTTIYVYSDNLLYIKIKNKENPNYSIIKVKSTITRKLTDSLRDKLHVIIESITHCLLLPKSTSRIKINASDIAQGINFDNCNNSINDSLKSKEKKPEPKFKCADTAKQPPKEKEVKKESKEEAKEEVKKESKEEVKEDKKKDEQPKEVKKEEKQQVINLPPREKFNKKKKGSRLNCKKK